MLVAGVMAAFVLGAVSMCLSQLSDAKTSSRMSLEAYLRADAALSALQRNIVSILRDEDLFHTRLLLHDGSTNTPLGHLDRDEILVFNTQLRPIRDLDFMGDGMQFETHFRIETDALRSVVRRLGLRLRRASPGRPGHGRRQRPPRRARPVRRAAGDGPHRDRDRPGPSAA
jgi:hypothetical protein